MTRCVGLGQIVGIVVALAIGLTRIGGAHVATADELAIIGGTTGNQHCDGCVNKTMCANACQTAMVICNYVTGTSQACTLQGDQNCNAGTDDTCGQFFSKACVSCP